MLLNKLISFLHRHYTKEFYQVFILAVIGGAAEFINLTILKYVITSLSSLGSSINLPDKNSASAYLIFLLIFSTAAVLSCRILVLRSLTFGSNRLGSEIAMNSISGMILERTITAKFKSSAVAATTSKALNLVNMVIYPTFLTISSVSSILLILIAFLYINYVYALVILLTGAFAFSSVLVFKRYFFKTADINILQDQHAETILGIIKCKIEILTYDIWYFFEQKLRTEDQTLRKSFAAVHFFMQLPRLFVDSFVIIAGLSIFWLYSQSLISQNSVTNLIIFGVGFMRLVPQTLQCIQALTTIKAYGSTFESFISTNLSSQKQTFAISENLAANELLIIHTTKGMRLRPEASEQGNDEAEHIDTIKVERGKKYLLRGPSGIGKSTLINKIVGISSQIDIPAYVQSRKNLRISYCPQFPGILPGDIYKNIEFGRENISEEQIIKTAKKLKLEPTRSVKNEDSLSGGEIARISLARALLAKPEILILDETLAPISEESVTDILKLLNAQQALTVLAIMHSESFDQHFDEVINMDVK